MKQIMLNTSAILFAASVVVLVFTFFYFHFANEKGLLSKTFNKKPNKPFVSYMFGALGVVLFANAVTLLILGLFS